ncbi:hypothetical protein ACFVXG_02820 [Kitasatospora sp. NPDC058162]|uniref:hypothetical protein n=1 Tax=Kitasatospora sp. NPDC058162 TaxID=3346362 RepID=UPI0036D98E1E
MNTATNTLVTRDPKWWHYPLAGTLLIPVCWIALQTVMIGDDLASDCALNSGCASGSRDTYRRVVLVLGRGQLLLAVAAWPLPLTRRWTIARFVLSALSAMCGAGTSLVVLTS